MANVVITGVAGFIGTNLCAAELKAGNKVIGVDNFCTGSKENITPFFDNKNFSFLEHDIVDPLPITEGVDRIYNLACPASPAHYLKIPIETLLAGSRGMHNVLELAKNNDARVVQSSTSEVYGDPLQHPQTEAYWGNVNPVGVRSCYDESKRFAEALIMAYKRSHGVNTGIVRIFNTYGPHMRKDDGRVISNFIVQALEGKPLTVYGDGEQTRSFCFVNDLILGLQKMMDGNHPGPINLGNPNEFTVKECAEKVIALTHSQSKIVFKPLPVDDPVKRKPDSTLAQKELGWKSPVSLENGLKETIAWFSR
jgi:nucleoside-diphosphate-sugar epimerase